MEPAERDDRLITRDPPYSIDAERAVLGAILIDRDAILQVADVISADDFYRKSHRIIYQALMDIWEGGEPPDIVLLSEKIENAGDLDAVGGRSYLSDLSGATPTAVYAASYAKVVKRKAVLRNLINAAGKIAGIAYADPEDTDEAVDQAQEAVYAVASNKSAGRYSALRPLLHEAFDRIDFLFNNKGKVSGVATGFRDLDDKTQGFQNSDLIILAARPSVGKSAISLNIAQYIAMTGKKKACIFSLEMSREQLVTRLLASVADLDSQKLRSGYLVEGDFAKLTDALGELYNAEIYIDDSPSLSITDLRTKARRMKMEVGMDILIIDYLQLMHAPGAAGKDANRAQEVSAISRGLKALARELDIPVVALSQLNRGVEGRDSAEPRLSDLRESGCLTGATLIQRADGNPPISLDTLMRDGWRDVSVWSVNDSGRVVAAQVSNAFATGVKPVLIANLASGRKIEATPNHRFLTLGGWQRLDRLAVGDRVAIPRILPEPAGAGLGWSEPRLALLAYLIADGTVLPRQPVHLTDDDEDVLAMAVAAASAEFGIQARRVDDASVRSPQIHLPSPRHNTSGFINPIAGWFDSLGIYPLRSKERCMPAAIYSASNTEVSIFLRHLWATDGCVWVDEQERLAPRVYYSTSSASLALGVMDLLSRLGITGRRRVTRKSGCSDNYHIDVSGHADLSRFVDSVGGFGRTGARVDALRAYLGSRTSNTNVDTLPIEVWDVVKAERQRAGLTERQLEAALGLSYNGSAFYRHCPSRERLMRCGEILKSDKLVEMASSDVFWDRITSLEPSGEVPVFDITTEGTHNFIADSIVVHNSIEQDADVVVFLWRKKSDEDEARDDGEWISVKVAKNRNGPIGEFQLWFRKQQTRFYSQDDRYE